MPQPTTVPIEEGDATDTHGSSTVLTNARVVLADRIVEGGSVVVEDGRIAAIENRSYATGAQNLHGRFLMPGIVCLHNDAIEREVFPRPNANIPIPFALMQLDRRLATAGITTQFHALSFSDRLMAYRSVAFATELARSIADFRSGDRHSLDHHSLLRIDLRCPDALDAVVKSLVGVTVPLLSLNDHVPGKGQYRSLESYRAYISRDLTHRDGSTDLDARIEAEVLHVEETEPIVQRTLQRIPELLGDHQATMVSHDDDSPATVDAMYELGCRISEFPLSADSAHRARELGMGVVMGAPNLLRGNSLSGNASAADLVARDLVTILCADYYAPAMLAAVFATAANGTRGLPEATRLVSLNPATSVGLTDRGQIAPGFRADLIVAEPTPSGPVVCGTMSAGRWTYLSGRFAPMV